MIERYCDKCHKKESKVRKIRILHVIGLDMQCDLCSECVVKLQKWLKEDL